jgi:hypothetical protein
MIISNSVKNVLIKMTYNQITVHMFSKMNIEARFFPSTDFLYQHKVCEKPYFGAHGAEEIPVPIPNTEVKLSSGDYTATSGKLARCRIIQ